MMQAAECEPGEVAHACHLFYSNLTQFQPNYHTHAKLAAQHQWNRTAQLYLY
jgi:hypothetical protein